MNFTFAHTKLMIFSLSLQKVTHQAIFHFGSVWCDATQDTRRIHYTCTYIYSYFDIDVYDVLCLRYIVMYSHIQGIDFDIFAYLRFVCGDNTIKRANDDDDVVHGVVLVVRSDRFGVFVYYVVSMKWYTAASVLQMCCALFASVDRACNLNVRAILDLFRFGRCILCGIVHRGYVC